MTTQLCCTYVVSYIKISLHILQFVDSLPCLQCYLQNKYTGVRHMSARCIGMISQLSTAEVMLFLIEKVLPMFEATDNDTQRQGASETIASILVHYVTCD